MTWRQIESVALCTCLGALMTACGSGPAATAVKPLYTTEAQIGPAGGTIEAPAPHGAKVTVPAGAEANAQSVAMSIYAPAAVGTAKKVATPLSEAVNLRGVSHLPAGKSLQITVPYTVPPESGTDFVAMADGSGHLLAVPAQFNATTRQCTFSVSDTDLATIGKAPTAAARSRFELPGWSWTVVHVKQIVKQPAAELKRFTWTKAAPPGGGDWSAWSDAGTAAWSSDHIAVVLHGMSNDLTDMGNLAFYLQSLRDAKNVPVYAQIYGVNYEWPANIADNAIKVAALLRQRLPAASTHHVDVYGHSMGGLVARWALEKDDPGSGIERLFTLSTPHNGVPLRGAATLLIAGAVGSDGVLLFDLTLPGVNDLLRLGTFLNRLDDDTRPPSYGKTSYLSFAANHWDGYLGGGGAAVHKLYVGADNNMDGIVPVDSAQYTGLATKSHAWTHPAERYDLNHRQARGEYGPAMAFNLDHAVASLNDSAVEEPFRTGAHRRLRDYILNTGIADVEVTR